MKTGPAAGPGLRWVAVVSIVAIFTAAPAVAQDLAYYGSLNYSTGTYIFSERTQAYMLNTCLTLQSGRLRVSGGVPLILQNSVVVNQVGTWWVPTGGPDHGAVRQRAPGETVPMGPRRGPGGQGQGGSFSVVAAVDTVAETGSYEINVADPLFTGALELYRGYGALRSFEVTGAVKTPVATLESGVGTGEWDWGGGLSMAVAAGRTLFFGDVGWWSYGDLPDLELKDGMSWGVGAGLPVNDRFSLLGSVSGAAAVIETVDAPLSLALAGSWSLRNGRSISAGVTAGLSEANPSVGVFMGWRLGLLSSVPRI